MENRGPKDDSSPETPDADDRQMGPVPRSPGDAVSAMPSDDQQQQQQQ